MVRFKLGLRRSLKALALTCVLVMLLLLQSGAAWAWRSSYYGVSFVPPAKWGERNTNLEGAEVCFVGPSVPGPRTNLSFAVQQLHGKESAHEELLPEYGKKAMQRVESEMEQVKILGHKSCRVAGRSAYRMSFRAAYKDGSLLQATMVMWVHRGNICLLTLVSSPETHSRYLKDLDKVLVSVRLVN